MKFFRMIAEALIPGEINRELLKSYLGWNVKRSFKEYRDVVNFSNRSIDELTALGRSSRYLSSLNHTESWE